MIIIEQRFPLGRFHATRWNQNSFEDRFGEWPPSPWRLLRALVARWFQYQRETGDADTNTRDELLRTLAAELPSFKLPADTWRGPGLRQYQPTEVKFTKMKAVPEVKVPLPTLALDGYRAIPDDTPIYWIWSGSVLSSDAQLLLNNLLNRIHYFGRCETWSVMRLIESLEMEVNCQLKPTAYSNSVPVLAPCPDVPLDINLLNSSTGDKVLSNRRIPPGTAWFYAELPPRTKSTFRYDPPQQHPPVHVARFALDSTVLPLITETLPVAEAARRALMGKYGAITEKDGEKGRSAVLSGKNDEGKMLTGHLHAFYIPTDEDNDGHLDHLTVYAPAGFHYGEQLAFDRLHVLRTGRQTETRYPLRTLLLGWGSSNDYRAGPLKESNIWISVTPYIATRYAKTKGRKRIDIGSPEDRFYFLREDLQNQLADVRPDLLDSITHIEPLWDENQVFLTADKFRPLQFKRYRHKAGEDGSRRLAGTFRLTFSRPVSGPLVMGWSNHFGMGLFMPLNSDG